MIEMTGKEMMRACASWLPLNDIETDYWIGETDWLAVHDEIVTVKLDREGEYSWYIGSKVLVYRNDDDDEQEDWCYGEADWAQSENVDMQFLVHVDDPYGTVKHVLLSEMIKMHRQTPFECDTSHDPSPAYSARTHSGSLCPVDALYEDPFSSY